MPVQLNLSTYQLSNKWSLKIVLKNWWPSFHRWKKSKITEASFFKHSMKALTERFQTPRRLHEKCSAAHLPQNGLMTVHHLPMTWFFSGCSANCQTVKESLRCWASPGGFAKSSPSAFKGPASEGFAWVKLKGYSRLGPTRSRVELLPKPRYIYIS